MKIIFNFLVGIIVSASLMAPFSYADCSSSSAENLAVIMSTLSNPDWVMYGPYTSQSSACSALQAIGASCYVSEYCSSCPDSGWYALRSYSPETAYYHIGECTSNGTADPENDSDSDGIPDGLDLCPNTSPAAAEYTDNQGCSVLQSAETADRYNGQDSNISLTTVPRRKLQIPSVF